MTTLANVSPIIPEVVGDGVRQKLGNLIKFIPLADVDNSLQGQAGTTIIVPSYDYIGDASDIAEGVAISAGDITASSKTVTIKKAVKDVLLTDEVVLGTGGAIVGEVEMQLAVAIANKIDADAMNSLNNATDVPQNIASFALTQAGFANARVFFGEDLLETFMIVNPAEYGKILAMPEFVSIDQGSAVMSGHVGNVMGLQIVVSGRQASGTGLLVQRGALGMALKRNVNAESFRDMASRSTRLGVDSHYATYVKNPVKACRILAFA